MPWQCCRHVFGGKKFKQHAGADVARADMYAASGAMRRTIYAYNKLTVFASLGYPDSVGWQHF